MDRVQAALRARELGWEVNRAVLDVDSKPTPDRPAAEEALASKVSAWTGQQVDIAAVRKIASDTT